MIQLTLPWPPSVNHYYRWVGSRMLISYEGRCYREAVVRLLRGLSRPPLLDRLQVDIQAFPPDRRRRDLDNAQKALLDAIQHAGVYADDSQIDRLQICRGDPVVGGRMVVMIDSIERAIAGTEELS